MDASSYCQVGKDGKMGGMEERKEKDRHSIPAPLYIIISLFILSYSTVSQVLFGRRRAPEANEEEFNRFGRLGSGGCVVIEGNRGNGRRNRAQDVSTVSRRSVSCFESIFTD